MQLKVLEDIGDSLFPQWDIALDLHIKSYLDIFITHNNINDTDIVDIIEYDIVCELSMFYKYSQIYMVFNLYAQAHKDAYIAILTELFLNDMIDFYLVDEPTQPTLSHYKENKCESWIYFKENFICKERFNADDFCETSWETPNKWSKHNINATLTPKRHKIL